MSKTKLLKRKLQRAEILYQFKCDRKRRRGHKMSGMDLGLIKETAAKFGVTVNQLVNYILTEVVE